MENYTRPGTERLGLQAAEYSLSEQEHFVLEEAQ